MINIWKPRYHDRKVLIAKYKVADGINRIRFTKAKHLKDQIFEMSGMVIQSYPVTTNGKIPCYEVPLEVVLDNKGEK